MKKTVTIILVISILLSALLKTYASEENNSLTILFTHDMHDHLTPSKVEENNTVVQLGGYARLKTAIDEEREKSENSILLDAGDYSMGTLFQSIFSSNASELRIMGQMGYDVTTLGNHEFDFRETGLTKHLNVAKNSGDKLPQIVNSNLSFLPDKELNSSLFELKQAMAKYEVKEYTVLERSGIKIGVFGVLGKEATSFAPESGVVFRDYIESAKNTVKKLKKIEKVDLIVCLSHSGTSEKPSESEDEHLAKEVSDIDVIISGHSHTKLENPIVIGKTVIGSCGIYGRNLGVINLNRGAGGNWELQDYRLRAIDSSLEGDSQINKVVAEYKKIIQEAYLKRFNMKFDEVLAKTSFSFTLYEEIGHKHCEEPLGNLISDSYIYSVKKAEGKNYEPITAAIVTAGIIRGTLMRGDITVSDVFSISSLGIGTDGVSGYPLISAYLTGKEIRDLCEVDASISPMLYNAQLYISGLSFTLNPNRMPFNKVTDIKVQNINGKLENLENKKLYRIVTGLYNAQMLSLVGDKSFGLLSIRLKTKDGIVITDFEKCIIYNNKEGTRNELKEWLSIAQYIKSFEKVDGIPQVPAYYKVTHNRKIIDNNKNIFAILSKPNSIALKLYAIILVLLLLIAFIVYIIVTRMKRRRRQKAYYAKS